MVGNIVLFLGTTMYEEDRFCLGCGTPQWHT